jgi:hypothetical protein
MTSTGMYIYPQMYTSGQKKMNLSMQLSKNNDFSHILLSLITL